MSLWRSHIQQTTDTCTKSLRGIYRRKCNRFRLIGSLNSITIIWSKFVCNFSWQETCQPNFSPPYSLHNLISFHLSCLSFDTIELKFPHSQSCLRFSFVLRPCWYFSPLDRVVLPFYFSAAPLRTGWQLCKLLSVLFICSKIVLVSKREHLKVRPSLLSPVALEWFRVCIRGHEAFPTVAPEATCSWTSVLRGWWAATFWVLSCSCTFALGLDNRIEFAAFGVFCLAGEAELTLCEFDRGHVVVWLAVRNKTLDVVLPLLTKPARLERLLQCTRCCSKFSCKLEN